MAVNTNSVGEEEIKYNINQDGTLKDVSKSVSPALGEAVGINKIISSDLTLFRKKLIECNNQDYFEKAIELSIKDGLKIIPTDISDFLCMEIDFQDDLSNINSMLK
jgi:Predicted sugar nucleotidyltransferases